MSPMYLKTRSDEQLQYLLEIYKDNPEVSQEIKEVLQKRQKK